VLGDLPVGVPARGGRRDSMVRVLHVDLVVSIYRVVVRRSFSKLRHTGSRGKGRRPSELAADPSDLPESIRMRTVDPVATEPTSSRRFVLPL
jgi:hypothetical protein